MSTYFLVGEREGEDKSTKKGIKRASTTTNIIHQIPNLMPVCGDRRELKGMVVLLKMCIITTTQLN